MDEPQRLFLGDLPEELRFEASQRLEPFTTILGWPGELVGSGTFVRVNGRSGILTAAHVWDHLYENREKNREITLLVARGFHSFSVPVNLCTPHLSIERKTDEWGPDIQFIELPPHKASQIAATKSFAEISALADKRFATASSDVGFGCIMGFPAEQSKRTDYGPDKVALELRGGFLSGIENETVRGEFDYVETLATPDVTDQPKSFGGVSGAGLWRVTLRLKKGRPIGEAEIDPDFALAGVAFYEEPTPNGGKLIRYHGPRTIYRKLVELVPRA
ncbi:MAG: hypothetical protein NVV63_02480 [Opitutus sp.]|nr:hypothetical protein [Opitutus sp.]